MGDREVKARALYFTGPGRVEIREELCPQAGQEVLVRSRLIGISAGTEMLAFRGQMPDDLQADDSLLNGGVPLNLLKL